MTRETEPGCAGGASGTNGRAARCGALDGELRRYQAFSRPFSPHVHDAYVIGAVRAGRRALTCNGEDLALRAGDLLVLNPGDVHGCAQEGAEPLAYDSMALGRGLVEELTGARDVRLRGPVLRDEGLGRLADEALDALEKAPGAAQGVLDAASGDVQGVIDAYRALRASLDQADPTSPLLPRVDQAILELANLQGSIIDASEALGQGAADAEKARTEVTARINEARSAVEDLHASYDTHLRDEAAALADTLEHVRSSSTELAAQVDATARSLSETSSSLGDNLDEVASSLASTAEVLGRAADDLAAARTSLSAALASGDTGAVRAIIGSDPARIAQFLAAPTQLDRHAVWPMADNGSAMSPFYTSLSLWIGAIFMVALMQVVVSPRRQAQLDHPTPGQLYLGRYGVFLVLGLAQATIVATGNVFFLGVQCDHVLLYYVAAWAAALVFTNLVYTLTVSFGNIGKACAIILLVLQLAGSGGIFPVQMSAEFFQAVYPWLPFTHSMEALQSAMAGIYGNQYWQSIGQLLALLAPSLFLGLVLRRPVIRLNDYVLRKLAETKVV